MTPILFFAQKKEASTTCVLQCNNKKKRKEKNTQNIIQHKFFWVWFHPVLPSTLMSSFLFYCFVKKSVFQRFFFQFSLVFSKLFFISVLLTFYMTRWKFPGISHFSITLPPFFLITPKFLVVFWWKIPLVHKMSFATFKGLKFF